VKFPQVVYKMLHVNSFQYLITDIRMHGRPDRQPECRMLSASH